MPIDGTSSTAIVIDDEDEDEDEDELFTRDEKSIVSVDDAAIVYDRNSRTQSSYVQDSELRPSDLQQPTGMLGMGGLQPLEQVTNDDQDEYLDPSNKSESVVQFNARFSTLRSEREGLGLMNSGIKQENAFFLPKSFSQAVPVTAPNDLVSQEHRDETRPSTNLIEN